MNDDYTFCVSECENENCFRHKSKIPTGIPVSMAKLKGTPECELARAEHGRWEEREHFTNDECPIDEWQSERCSVCDKYLTTPYRYYFFHHNYCPYCGARIESEE